MLERLRPVKGRRDAKQTLLLENFQFMPSKYQLLLLDLIRQGRLDARIIATTDLSQPPTDDIDESAESSETRASASDTERALLRLISTIDIRIPKLAERLEDLPILAQYFLELSNRASSKQVGSLRPDALDALALYSWPGDVEQLGEMIELAHAACTSHAIAAADLPPIFYQAFQATARKRPQLEPIVLDDLLASIEREAITRALSQTGGNKSEAATLLGMTRPRLYRRLVQLGFVSDEIDSSAFIEAPEFIEQDNTE
jgi:DNA-binding NtrC family response regulator